MVCDKSEHADLLSHYPGDGAANLASPEYAGLQCAGDIVMALNSPGTYYPAANCST